MAPPTTSMTHPTQSLTRSRYFPHPPLSIAHPRPLQLFRKEAIFRKMKHYAREHQRGLARIAELERRKSTCEAGLAAISACWAQVWLHRSSLACLLDRSHSSSKLSAFWPGRRTFLSPITVNTSLRPLKSLFTQPSHSPLPQSSSASRHISQKTPRPMSTPFSNIVVWPPTTWSPVLLSSIGPPILPFSTMRCIQSAKLHGQRWARCVLLLYVF
jgi:hypothetical protein